MRIVKSLGDASLGLRAESRLPAGSGRLVLGIVVVGLLFQVVPRLEGWTLLHVHKEDGVIFLADFLQRGWSSLTEPYTGYQHLVPRTIAGACATGPASWFAGCAGVGASLVRVALAVMALAVVAPYARSRWWAVAAATVFIWAPVGQQEALTNLTNLRWFLDAGAVVLLLGVWRKSSAIGLVSLVAVGAAMTDPLAVVVAPIAVWRLLVLTGRERVAPAVFLLAALAHFLVLDIGARSSNGSIYVDDPGGSLAQLLVRGVGVSVFGQNGTEVLLIIGVPVAVLAALVVIAVAGIKVRWSPTVALALVLTTWGMGMLAVTLTFSDMTMLGLDPAWQLGQGSRYSITPGVLLAMSLLLSLPFALERARGFWRVPIYAVLLAFPLAVLADSPGDSWNTADPTWAEELTAARAACQSGQDQVNVQMTPSGVSTDWTVDLPCSWLVG